MKFASKEDIEAPIDQVFRMVSDFDNLERQAMRRGADIRRMGAAEKGVGMEWLAKFAFRGREREVKIEIVEYEPPHSIVADSVSGGLEAECRIDLVALSRRRTRLSVELELKPQTLSARLLVQSLKLAKGRMTKRFHLRMAEYARDLEDRFQRKV